MVALDSHAHIRIGSVPVVIHRVALQEATEEAGIVTILVVQQTDLRIERWPVNRNGLP